MAKKKNWQKKHNFKHVSASETVAAGSVASPAKPAAPKAAVAGGAAPTKAAATVTVRDFSYVAGDMRRIGMAAILLVALEIVLYFILTKTPAGSAIYGLVKL